MSKYLILFIGLCLSPCIKAQELSASIKTPVTAQAGSEFTVEISINKAGLTGFMKFYQELPEGYTATAIETKSGSFSNTDGGVKIVWIAPPADPEFTISYKIAVPASATGTISLAGKISYIVENERKAFELPESSINLGGNSIAAKTESPKPTAVIPTPKETETTAPPVAETKPAEPVKQAVPAEQPKPVTVVKQSTVVPTTAEVNPGRIYKVQIGAFASKPNLTGVPEMSTFVLENGITKYFSGSFSNYADAAKRRAEMLNQGYMGAFIVAFENGKIVH